MSEYVVTISVCGGSQAEAADPDVVIGPFPTAEAANNVSRYIYGYCSGKSNTCRQEMLATVHRITTIEDGAESIEQLAEHVFGDYWEDDEDE